MKRRDFIKYSGTVTLGASLPAQIASGTSRSRSSTGPKLKAKDIQAYIRSLDRGWINLEETVDTFKSGSPDTEVTGIGVGWMSYTWALKRTLDLGFNMFITHEPTYYEHRDNDPYMFAIEVVAAKKRFIEESGIVILRCHDLWDRYPNIGITDGWAKQLGFSNPVYRDGYYRVFDVKGRTAGEVARQVAKKVAPLGQEAVQLIGEESAEVTRAAIGFGAGTPYRHFITELEADLAICSDDGIRYWRDGALAIDQGPPIIVVNHAVTEENGMKLLAAHLAERFPQIPITHIPQRCMYTLVRS